MATVIPDTHKTCFFDLTAELRNRIYESLVPVGEIIQIRRGGSTPPILRVNRQIRAEASKVYYNSNVFDVKYFSCIQWLRSRQLQSRLRIRFVYLSACPWISSPKLYEASYVRRGVWDMRQKVTELGLSQHVRFKFE